MATSQSGRKACNSRICRNDSTHPPRPKNRTALLDAAEVILERDGPTGLTLRAAARAAGVSHAAPTHHFGDLTGLLSELAAVGYRRFTERLRQAAEAAGTGPNDRLIALGKAYVVFARAYPNLFLLMFRRGRLDRDRPALKEAADEAFAVLRGTAAAVSAPTGSDSLAEAFGAWSLVHGFALLTIDGHLPPDRSPDELLNAVLTRRRSNSSPCPDDPA